MNVIKTNDSIGMNTSGGFTPMQISLGTGPGVYGVLAHICRSPLEAVRQFVENAADAIQVAGEPAGHIDIHAVSVTRQGLVLTIEDNGAGISPDKMAQVLRTIGHSEKLRLALRGEKGVGILGFALLCEEMHISSSTGSLSNSSGSPTSACLVLQRSSIERGEGAVLDPCPMHHRESRGTTVTLIGVLPEAAAAINPKRLREYLGREFASDLRDRRYSMVFETAGRWETVEPLRLRGLAVLSDALPLEVWGSAVADVRLLPIDASPTGLHLYGRGGVRVCPLASVEELAGSVWLDRRLEGFVRCERLRLTADKTAIVQDGIYAQFIAALKAAEPRLAKSISDATQEHMDRRLAQVTRRVDSLVERFLKHVEEGAPLRPPVRRAGSNTTAIRGETPDTPPIARVAAQRRPGPIHFRIGEPGQVRQDWQSRGGAAMEVVEINSQHPDFLEAESDMERCSRYLFSLWAKEHLLAEYGSDSRKVAEVLLSWLNKADPLLTAR